MFQQICWQKNTTCVCNGEFVVRPLRCLPQSLNVMLQHEKRLVFCDGTYIQPSFRSKYKISQKTVSFFVVKLPWKNDAGIYLKMQFCFHALPELQIGIVGRTQSIVSFIIKYFYNSVLCFLESNCSHMLLVSLPSVSCVCYSKGFVVFIIICFQIEGTSANFDHGQQLNSSVMQNPSQTGTLHSSHMSPSWICSFSRVELWFIERSARKGDNTLSPCMMTCLANLTLVRTIWSSLGVWQNPNDTERAKEVSLKNQLCPTWWHALKKECGRIA